MTTDGTSNMNFYINLNDRPRSLNKNYLTYFKCIKILSVGYNFVFIIYNCL